MTDNIAQLIPDFCEQSYLAANPDVAKAVSERIFNRGWEHYLLYGYSERRPGGPGTIDERVRQVLSDPESRPSPSPTLRARVHGATDIASYLRLGKTVALDLHATLARLGATPQSMLDFGCGSGRVISWLHYLYPHATYQATDIDKEAISWCQTHLSTLADFGVNQHQPPLIYDDNTFDCAYSISIFTHLPETMQFAWLAELARVVRPEGLLMLTTHGGALLPEQADRSEYEKTGFYYLDGDGTPGLPDFYQNSYHSHAYIRERWSEYFDVVDIVPLGIAGHQDLIIGRARG